MTVPSWCERHEWAITALLAAGLTAISLIPVWAVHFPPLQDYPLHLLRGHIIAHYSDPQSRYYDTFVVSLFPIPYILTDYIVGGLAGATLRELQELGGWSSLELVERYSKVTRERIRETLSRMALAPMDSSAECTVSARAGRVEIRSLAK